MSAASKPATAAFAPITGASSGIGAPCRRPAIVAFCKQPKDHCQQQMTSDSDRRKDSVHQFDHHVCRIKLKESRRSLKCLT